MTKEFAVTLKEKVKFPNGMAETTLNYFKSKNLSDIVYEVMKQAVKRFREISK